ncbi:hypothetical protein EKO04_010832 [Ascochyta lentis]|uniref:Uncharacterized protein n=1 Tax=Ascochyta lentis TaxID=205686 RepID=A0A8H7MBJ9_9PLEO|nr:hypothetical protein EKO04_010832 [Ascochyta lentis]
MFDQPFDQPFSSHAPLTHRRRHRRSSWDMYDSDMSPISSYEHVHHTRLITAPPSSFSTRTYERIRYPSSPLSTTELPARVSALNRRGATLSTYLAHVAAVVEPLKSAKVDEMSELDLRDLMQEGEGLQDAMQNFEEQFAEVWAMLEEVMAQRKGVVHSLVRGGGGAGEDKGSRKGRKGLY